MYERLYMSAFPCACTTPVHKAYLLCSRANTSTCAQAEANRARVLSTLLIICQTCSGMHNVFACMHAHKRGVDVYESITDPPNCQAGG